MKKDIYDLPGLSYYSFFKGNAENSLRSNLNAEFSTIDKDHNRNTGGNCAKRFMGAWWYPTTNCGESNLNGIYHSSGIANSGSGILWDSWNNNPGTSATKAEMKIKPDCIGN